MRFAGCDHHHPVADDLAAELHDPAMVAGAERIAEIAARPWMRINFVLDRDHAIEIFRSHAAVARQIVEQRAHRSCSSSRGVVLPRSSARGVALPRSSTRRAILLRTYSGAACSAAIELPFWNSIAASTATSRACGARSARTPASLPA